MDVLLVEDSLGDIRLTREALREVNPAVHLHVVMDGEEAVEFLTCRGKYVLAPRPDLVLLDLNLPTMNGREVLAHIKTNDHLKNIPIIILTTSADETDIVKCYQLHANCFLKKPLDLGTFDQIVTLINDFWLTLAKLPPHAQKSTEVHAQLASLA